MILFIDNVIFIDHLKKIKKKGKREEERGFCHQINV